MTLLPAISLLDMSSLLDVIRVPRLDQESGKLSGVSLLESRGLHQDIQSQNAQASRTFHRLREFVAPHF